MKTWQDRVGIIEANKIKNVAARGGTYMHDSLEKYIQSKWVDKVNDLDAVVNGFKKNPIGFVDFKKIKIQLDENLDSVLELETQLQSKILKTAGRCDLIGLWKNIPSIIDFKTSRSPKEKSHIETYFLQTTAYSIMYQELTGIKIEQLVVLFATQGENYCYGYTENRANYIEKLAEVINSYYKANRNFINEVNQEYA